MKLTARAPGKINLSLFLGGPRPDGRHELVTLLESVSLADELELTTDPGLRADVVSCPGVAGPNLAARALAELRARGWEAPSVRLEIRKRLPVAAGMGGGSADAAATLRLAAALAPLPSHVAISDVAAGLGTDVPSQLEPGLALGTGAGEVITPAPALAPHAFVIVPLAARLATADVYAEADRLGLPRAAAELDDLRRQLAAALAPSAGLPGELIVNDLEPGARSLCPQIEAALEGMRETGADQALVCGSGPTVAGLFWDGARSAAAAAIELAARFPSATTATPVDADFGAARQLG